MGEVAIEAEFRKMKGLAVSVRGGTGLANGGSDDPRLVVSDVGRASRPPTGTVAGKGGRSTFQKESTMKKVSLVLALVLLVGMATASFAGVAAPASSSTAVSAANVQALHALLGSESVPGFLLVDTTQSWTACELECKSQRADCMEFNPPSVCGAEYQACVAWC